MRRHATRRVLSVIGLIAVAAVASGCEIDLFQADCSWIDQPDMGGLVCLGLNFLGLGASAIAIIVAILVWLGGLPK